MVSNCSFFKMASPITFLSLNVGLSSNLGGLRTILSMHKIDIVFLQEIRITEEQLNLSMGNLGFTGAVNINQEDFAKPGTAIIWRSNLPVRDVSTITTCKAQCAFLGPYAMLNIYAPSGSYRKYERGAFFSQEVFRALRLHPSSSWILGGDFNCVLKPIDIENGVGFLQKNCLQLSDLVKSINLADVFRSKYPGKQEFTFFRAQVAPSRLDRFYVSANLLGGLVEVSHIASLSDHCGTLMELRLGNISWSVQQPRGRQTYWKLNTSILREEEFLEDFGRLWSWLQQSKSDFIDIADWWDLLAKPNIKEFCILFSKRRSVRRNDTKKFLLSYLKICLGAKDWNEVARVKSKIDKMLKEDSMGFKVRSRFKQNLENESASLFHANREAKNAAKNNV